MQRTCIAIVDATRARLFTLDRNAEAGGVIESFSERTDLVNPARRQTPSQLFSDTRTNTSRTGGKFYGVDDHRDAHMEHLDAEFAKSIADTIRRTVRETGATKLIVCAAPRMLGELRSAELPREIAVQELARDYSKLTPPQIREELGEHGLLPAPPPRALA